MIVFGCLKANIPLSPLPLYSSVLLGEHLSHKMSKYWRESSPLRAERGGGKVFKYVCTERRRGGGGFNLSFFEIVARWTLVTSGGVLSSWHHTFASNFFPSHLTYLDATSLVSMHHRWRKGEGLGPFYPLSQRRNWQFCKGGAQKIHNGVLGSRDSMNVENVWNFSTKWGNFRKFEILFNLIS